MSAVLLAHSEPSTIHGGAVAAKTLLEEAAGWSHVSLAHVNAVYTENRNSLRAFRIGKVVRLCRYLSATVKLVRRDSASVVIVTPAFFPGPFLKDAFVILSLRVLTNARIIGWVHMDPFRLDLEKKPGWYRYLARKVFETVDCWVACAPALMNLWPSFLSVNRRHAIPNGIAAPRMPQRVHIRERLRVVYLSAMHQEKGWRDLLEAACMICDKHANIEFHFYGNPTGEFSADRLHALFKGLLHSDRISWHGPAWGEDKWRALANADLFCFPSHTEQFSIAVLEAMASGLPVIATRVGAIEDAVISGHGGWLVDSRTPDQIVEALEDALSDRARLIRFGNFNRTRYELFFTRTKFGQQWESLLAKFAKS